MDGGVTIDVRDLMSWAGRVGARAVLEDQGLPSGGWMLIDGSVDSWRRLSTQSEGDVVETNDFLRCLPLVVIARVRGACSGAATSLLSVADLVLAVDSTGYEGNSHLFADETRIEEELQGLLQAIQRRPQAAGYAAMAMRAAERVSLEHGLMVERLTYAILQAGSEYHAWLRHRKASHVSVVHGSQPRVVVERDGDHVDVVLCRPERHNAVDHRMRDELIQAFRGLLLDDSVTSVSLRGQGPSFCSGGDIDEFSLPDPMESLAIRSARGLPSLVARLGHRLTVHVHGACVGAGLELAAFGGRVVADPQTSFWLPEAGMGLIPGMGGTVSVPRRIGRGATMMMLLTERRLSAPQALEIGLVDCIAEVGSPTW